MMKEKMEKNQMDGEELSWERAFLLTSHGKFSGTGHSEAEQSPSASVHNPGQEQLHRCCNVRLQISNCGPQTSHTRLPEAPVREKISFHSLWMYWWCAAICYGYKRVQSLQQGRRCPGIPRGSRGKNKQLFHRCFRICMPLCHRNIKELHTFTTFSVLGVKFFWGSGLVVEVDTTPRIPFKITSWRKHDKLIFNIYFSLREECVIYLLND